MALLFKARTQRIKRLRDPESRPTPVRRVSPEELYNKSTSMSVKGRPVMGLSGIRPQTVVRKPN